MNGMLAKLCTLATLIVLLFDNMRTPSAHMFGRKISLCVVDINQGCKSVLGRIYVIWCRVRVQVRVQVYVSVSDSSNFLFKDMGTRQYIHIT